MIPDGAGIADVGELWNGMDRRAASGKVGLLAESFGATTWQVEVDVLDGGGGVRPRLLVQGPLAAVSSGTLERAAGSAVAHDLGADGADGGTLRVSLPTHAAGVWRVIATAVDASGAQVDAAVRIRSACLAACARRSVSLNELLEGWYGDDATRAAVVDKLAETVTTLIGSEGAGGGAELVASFKAKLTRSEGRGDSLDRLLTFSPHSLGVLFSLSSAWERLTPGPTETPNVIASDRRQRVVAAARAEFPSGDLWKDLATADGKGYGPTPTWPELGMASGSWSRASLTSLGLAQSRRLAKLLDALARQPKRTELDVRVDGKRLATVDELYAAIVASGHVVTMTSERMYADFFHVIYRGVPVRMAPWVSTPVKVGGGAAVAVPMTHTHFSWRVEGPAVNAKVMFYLGTGGVSFMEDTYAGLDWWMHHQPLTVRSDDPAAAPAIPKALSVAAAYLRRNDREGTKGGKRMKGDGYGVLGVCNDTEALIEQGVFGQVSVYPLLRQATPAGTAALELDDLIATLPSDVAVLGSVGADTPEGRAIGRRILGATPRAPAWRPSWRQLGEQFDKRLADDVGRLATAVE